MGIALRHRSGVDAATVLDSSYGDAYEEIYAEPPYNSGPLFTRERFLERTRDQVHRSGFDLVSAEDGSTLAGFTFGFTMAAERWWGGESTPPPAKVAGVPKLAVIELILRKPYRGQGIGKRLLSTLLDGRAELYATLLSHPEAPAHALYERWGWEVAGTCRPAPDAPVMDIMILARKPHAPRSA
ncbi:GNAT superfamily N-acetyltransferase [Thermocatellispora tengchongensis]|uniref:GNAT superfamily N-acetyltransferase n=1 Tax=Thermocatellispora tengchongensis TaxID=1073253 RepID=A0A840PRR3_9ACTN|nr:GNAT family N-acetyltransferase [Thermocatellispora tengchongensis]MBB5138655.1 GNAT superfamily N-acetyltransferase [Thermocatellispora tengchongensis]